MKERESTGRPVLLSQSHQLKIPSSECTAATSSRVRRGGRGGEERSSLVTHGSVKDPETPEAPLLFCRGMNQQCDFFFCPNRTPLCPCVASI